MNAIDTCVIEDEDYTKRVAEEIYRVTPKEGIFMCNNCNGIWKYSKRLFPKFEGSCSLKANFFK